jgi:hypothetical protein
MNVPEEIRALADRALTDANAEQRAAIEAIARANAYLDKHHELMSLALRVEGVSITHTRFDADGNIVHEHVAPCDFYATNDAQA